MGVLAGVVVENGASAVFFPYLLLPLCSSFYSLKK